MRAARSRVVAKTSPAIPALPEGAAAASGFAERYALVCEAVAEGIYEWDIERNALFPSGRLVEIFGFEGRSLGADDWNEIVHPADFPIYRAAIRDCFRGVTARLDCEYRVRHSDGAYRWIEDRALAVRDKRGRATRLVGAVSDITERKEAERALREALEQQTATAEVLQVVNSSPGDLGPVFDAMLASATRLCEAHTGHLLRYENGDFRRAASLGVPEDFDKILPLNTPVTHLMNPESGPNRMLASRAVVHMHDLREDESYRTGAPAEVTAAEAGIRSCLFVPLLKEGEVVGCFVMHRLEVRPFSEKQIALLQNFAAQAVIAMENARPPHRASARPWSSRPRRPRSCASFRVPRPTSSRPSTRSPAPRRR